MLCHLATFQTTYCLSIRGDANSKSIEKSSTKMNLVSKKKRMSAGAFFSQNTHPNQCLATQDTFALKDRTDFESVAFQLLG